MRTEYVNCDLCGADDYVLWGKKDGLSIVQCRKCSLVYVNPRLDQEELSAYYSQQYFVDGGYDSDTFRKEMYKIEINTQILKMAGNSGKFLDIGCAFGSFLAALPDTFEKFGLEYSSDAAKYVTATYGFTVEVGQLHQSKYPKSYFDIIHLRGVIEHLQTPTNDLIKAHELLKSSGILIISTTPNIESPAAKRFGPNFRLVMPKEHIYYFSPRTLKALLHKTGFRPIRFFYPYLNTPYANLFRDIRDFFLNIYFNKPSPPFFGSVMTVYARKY